jgi:hypothetical protein
MLKVKGELVIGSAAKGGGLTLELTWALALPKGEVGDSLKSDWGTLGASIGEKGVAVTGAGTCAKGEAGDAGAASRNGLGGS